MLCRPVEIPGTSSPVLLLPLQKRGRLPRGIGLRNPIGRRGNRFLSQRRGPRIAERSQPPQWLIMVGSHSIVPRTTIFRCSHLVSSATLRSWNEDAAPGPESYDGSRWWVPTHGLFCLISRRNTYIILSARVRSPLSNRKNALCF